MRENPSPKNLDEVARSLDRAAKKKIIHPNKSNRLKSRLNKLLKTKKVNLLYKTSPSRLYLT